MKKLLAAYIIIALLGDVKIAIYGGICLILFTSTVNIMTLIFGQDFTESQALGDPSKDSSIALIIKGFVGILNFFATWGIFITLIVGVISIFN